MFYFQVAGRALDIPVNKIHLSETSSGVIPNSTATGGSSAADLNGAALLVRSLLTIVSNQMTLQCCYQNA